MRREEGKGLIDVRREVDGERRWSSEGEMGEQRERWGVGEVVEVIVKRCGMRSDCKATLLGQLTNTWRVLKREVQAYKIASNPTQSVTMNPTFGSTCRG